MSEETKERSDQADELRKLFNEVQEESVQPAQLDKGETGSSEIEQHVEHVREVDILNLPPRSEVHSASNKRTRVKLSGASLRLIIVVFIFLALLGGAYYLWGQELMEVIKNI
ncbi:hypothetical protein [Virgibacillus sp. JSM 102003]|uniref:hypothetical protein n=1 Tax=Virgibacillus sp. JSM 102003 TaxID=1562108 RepID=UPI0035C16737